MGPPRACRGATGHARLFRQMAFSALLVLASQCPGQTTWRFALLPSKASQSSGSSLEQIYADRGLSGIQDVLCKQAQGVMTESAYESYVETLITALQLPALEYQARYAADSEEEFQGLTMQSARLLRGLKKQVEDVVDRGLTGDIYESGTWRGGTAIFMVCVLQAYERLRGASQEDRQFWFFDSFEGFREQGEDEEMDTWLAASYFAAPLDMVKDSFVAYGAFSERVHLVKGFFEDTMPRHRPSRPIALLRMDGDLYSSTITVLEHLYPSVQQHGWIVVDDYYWRPTLESSRVTLAPLAREAVDEYRAVNWISDPLTEDFGRPSWRKSSDDVRYGATHDGSESRSNPVQDLLRQLLTLAFRALFRVRAALIALAIYAFGQGTDE